MNEFGNPLRKFKLVFLGEQSGQWSVEAKLNITIFGFNVMVKKPGSNYKIF